MMPDLLLGMIVGAMILLIGFTLGRAHRPQKGPPKPPPEICQCGHAVSEHDKNGCHHVSTIYEKVIVGYEEYFGGQTRHPVTDRKVVGSATCSCVRYVGPNSSYVPELEG